MRYLLDTHAFLWFVAGDDRLSETARMLIADRQNSLALSIASLWEIAIKISLGKLTLKQPYEILIPGQLALHGIEVLEITVAHTAALIGLPFHHRDPFDRMLIAQSQTEQLPLISTDKIFDAYGVTRYW
ncbi:MAG: type II toxin-antitoxin system VapC family toxin [Anaerolineae bacterium]|nr:type II toxin-antitoxin system VapC family toxin [Anaerolineae bacterium]